MTDPMLILDPTDEREPIERRRARRPTTLSGPLGIIDISKARGDIFCDELARLIAGRMHGIEIIRLRKPTFTKPAPPDLREEIATRCKAVIQALAD